MGVSVIPRPGRVGEITVMATPGVGCPSDDDEPLSAVGLASCPEEDEPLSAVGFTSCPVELLTSGVGLLCGRVIGCDPPPTGVKNSPAC